MTPEDWAELKLLARRLVVKRELAASQCNGKQRFTSRQGAVLSIHGRLKNICKPYRCTSCQGWHVGDQKHRRKKDLAYQVRRNRIEERT